MTHDSFIHGVTPQFQVTTWRRAILTPGPCTMKPGVSHPSPGPGTLSACGGPSTHPRAGSEQLRDLGLLSNVGGASDGARSPWGWVLRGDPRGSTPRPQLDAFRKQRVRWEDRAWKSGERLWLAPSTGLGAQPAGCTRPLLALRSAPAPRRPPLSPSDSPHPDHWGDALLWSPGPGCLLPP